MKNSHNPHYKIVGSRPDNRRIELENALHLDEPSESCRKSMEVRCWGSGDFFESRLGLESSPIRSNAVVRDSKVLGIFGCFQVVPKMGLVKIIAVYLNNFKAVTEKMRKKEIFRWKNYLLYVIKPKFMKLFLKKRFKNHNPVSLRPYKI